MLLEAYGVYAVARYDEVHRCLTDWQSLQSGAGVGLSNFTKEKPWRPPSLLLEADPPRHDAPRAVLSQLLSQRRLRVLEEEWKADAAQLVDELLARGTEFDAIADLAEVLPAARLPRRGRASARAGGSTCCPTATSPSTRSVRRTSS